MTPLEEARIYLIKEVQAACSFWDASAQSAACSFARDQKNKEKSVDAAIAMARADGCSGIQQLLIDAVEKAFYSLSKKASTEQP